MSGTNTPRIEINGSRKRYIYECSVCGNDAKYHHRTKADPLCLECARKREIERSRKRLDARANTKLRDFAHWLYDNDCLRDGVLYAKLVDQFLESEKQNDN